MQATRSTKYTTEVKSIIKEYNHATNNQILKELRQTYPEVTATTVHRITARMAERGEISEAPLNMHGSLRYDSNTSDHDHFLCQSCGGIRDIDVASSVIPEISEALGGCKITGRLVINGSCETCLVKKKEKK
jgi:Fur family peroxide stress response transcriptional regulator